MNSAAVIGRQLRQQATTGRTSGPLVPPQVPGKGRPRTPSHQPNSGRPYSPAPASMTGMTGERYNVVPGAGGGGGPGGTHLSYPSPQVGLHGEKDRGEEPKLKCTWHCFCVALKALSGGLVLLVAGTIMSVVGFVADANHNSTQTLSNDTVIETPLPSVFRNLTFAGPVIMGLGGIVIVAALVLTFEVRDTLGVKVVPAKPQPPPPTAPSLIVKDSSVAKISGNGRPPIDGSTTTLGKTSSSVNMSSSDQQQRNRKEGIPSITSTLSPENRISGHGNSNYQRETANSSSSNILPRSADKDASNARNSNSGKGKNKIDPSSLTIPFDVLSDLGPGPGHFSSRNNRVGDISSETAFNGLLPMDDPLMDPKPGTKYADNHRDKIQVRTNRRGYAPLGDNLISSPPNGKASYSHMISPNIESFYFALPSPQETELSDPEGCSLTVPARWRSSRCSCSASPTHSMSMELYLDQKDPPINIKIIEQQRIQEQLILQQQILLKQQQDQLQRLIEQANSLGRPVTFRRPKVLASIESDGLSSTSSSSDDLFVPLRRSRPPSSTSPFTVNSGTNHHNHHHYSHSASFYQKALPHPASSASSALATRSSPGEPLDLTGLRSELSSEFSSNQSDLDSPLHLDLDEDLSRALTQLSENKSKSSASKASDKQQQQLSVPPILSQTSAATRTKTETSETSESESTQDIRFPLLREGALGNGSVPRKR